MKYTLIMLVIGLSMGCVKEDSSDMLTEQSLKLKSITQSSDNGDWMESFEYDTNGNLIQKNYNHPQRERILKYEYRDGKLDQIDHFSLDEETLMNRDTLGYNSSGNVERIIRYAQEEFHLMFEYKYDDSNNLIESKRYDNTMELSSSQKFYWNEGNVEKVENYDRNGNLNFEFNYKYDNQKNPFEQFTMSSTTNPLPYIDKNNKTEISWIAYGGTISYDCNPCNIETNYNETGYPTRMEIEFGSTVQEFRYQ